MSMKPKTTVRFMVVAPDGRRSAVWRVWTGDKRPTDEVYAAPRLRASELKFSLHSSGYRQLGYNGPVRGQLRAGDRAAIAQWTRNDGVEVGGWSPALILMFADSELRAIPGRVGDEVLRIPAAPHGQAVGVCVLIGEPGMSTQGLDAVALLDRDRGSALVALIVSYGPMGPAEPLRLREELNQSIALVIPGIVNPEPFDMRIGEAAGGGTPRALEVARDDVDVLPALPPFTGEVLPWIECPEEFQDRELACGFLVYAENGNHRLYVDQRSRCAHGRLGQNAQDLCDAVQRDGFDEGWGVLKADEMYTVLSTRAVLDDHGLEWRDGGKVALPPRD